MLLNDDEIKKAMDTDGLIIDNFSEERLQPASYDMRLGKEAFTSSGREKVDVEGRGTLIIEAGDFAMVTTLEQITMPLKLAAHIGLRSEFARKGVVLLSGPQIDPGFEGLLVVGLCNLSPNDIVMTFKQPFCTIEFIKLLEPVKKPYSGPYQRQTGIPSIDIENIIKAKGMTFGEVIKAIGALSKDVKALGDSVGSLNKSVNRSYIFISLIVLAGMAIITAITFLR